MYQAHGDIRCEVLTHFRSEVANGIGRQSDYSHLSFLISHSTPSGCLPYVSLTSDRCKKADHRPQWQHRKQQHATRKQPPPPRRAKSQLHVDISLAHHSCRGSPLSFWTSFISWERPAKACEMLCWWSGIQTQHLVWRAASLKSV